VFKAVKILFLTVIVLTTCACGYRFESTAGLPGDVETFAVKMFENETSMTGLEATVTNQVLFEVTKRNPTFLSKRLQNADALLTGVIFSEPDETVAAKGRDAAAQRRVTIEVNLKLTKTNGEVVWVAQGVTDNEVYRVSDDKLATEQNKRNAVLILTERLAERIYNRLTDQF